MSINFNDVFGSAQLNINNPKLEELINKTKNVAEAVGKKSAEGIDLSRKKLEELELKGKLSKLYEKFGEMQYRAFLGEEIESSALEASAAEISQLKDKLDLLLAEIEDAKAAFTDAKS